MKSNDPTCDRCPNRAQFRTRKIGAARVEGALCSACWYASEGLQSIGTIAGPILGGAVQHSAPEPASTVWKTREEADARAAKVLYYLGVSPLVWDTERGHEVRPDSPLVPGFTGPKYSA